MCQEISWVWMGESATLSMTQQWIRQCELHRDLLTHKVIWPWINDFKCMFNGCVYFVLALPQQLLLPSSMFCKVYQNSCAVVPVLKNAFDALINIKYMLRTLQRVFKANVWRGGKNEMLKHHCSAWSRAPEQLDWSELPKFVRPFYSKCFFIRVGIFVFAFVPLKPAVLIDCCCVSHPMDVGAEHWWTDWWSPVVVVSQSLSPGW